MISIKIKDPLFTYHARLVNILDFNPEKLSVEKVCAINDELEHIYNVKYDNININNVNFGFSDYFRDRGVIRFDTVDTLPLDAMVSMYSMTTVIRSVYKTYCDRFYPEIHLANCIYVQSN